MEKTQAVEDLEGYPHETLRLPEFRQPQKAPDCIHYALWVSIQYVANAYPNKKARAKTKPQKIDDIREYIDIGEIGWENPRQDPLTELSTEVSSLQFKLEYKYNGLPQEAEDIIEDGLDILLPTILFIDNDLIKNGNREEGPLHAVVACGLGDEKATIFDPLVEGKTVISVDRLNEAWDPEFNTCVKIRVSTGIQPVRREEI